MKPAPFHYVRAGSAAEAASLLASDDPGSVRILAGGQSLIPALSARTERPALLVDIMGCAGLDHIRRTGEGLCIGPTCRQSAL